MNLRPYQNDFIQSVENGWDESSRQMGVLPTGAGKTICFSALAARRIERDGGKTLILAHREELIDQAVCKIKAATGITAEVEKADKWACPDAKIVVGSIQTMQGNRLERWKRDHFAQVVIDECHHSLATSYRNILNHFDVWADILGVTATPDRGDQRNLGEYFERIAYQIGLFDLIKLRFLSRISVKAIPLNIDIKEVGSMAGDFASDDLGKTIEPHLDEIAKSIADNTLMRKTLVFLPLIQTSIKFVEACRRVGIRAAHVSGESDDRSDTLARFKCGEFDLLSNAMLLTEGYDEPSIDCVVILRPTRSRALYSQMVGRGTRIDEGKENLLLLDFLWNHERHRLCRPASLVSECETHEDVITEITQGKGGGESQDELDLGELASAAMHEREKRLLAKMAENKSKKKVLLTAEEFAAKHDAISLCDYEPVMRWESAPISAKQEWKLKRAKIDVSTIKGKGHAAKLIDIINREQSVKPASEKQKAYLRRRGFSDWQNATAADAAKFFAMSNRR